MTGYTVHTGATEKFVEGWDRIFKKGAKGAKKRDDAAGAKPAKKKGSAAKPAQAARKKAPAKKKKR